MVANGGFTTAAATTSSNSKSNLVTSSAEGFDPFLSAKLLRNLGEKGDDGFRKLSYGQQWDVTVAYNAIYGESEKLMAYVFHCVVNVCLLLMFGGIAYFFVPIPETTKNYWFLDEDYQNCLLKNAFVFCYLATFIGFGCHYQGPLYGEPTLRLTTYRFRRGLPKLDLWNFIKSPSFWSGKPEPTNPPDVALVSTRGYLDILHTWYTIGMCGWLLVTPQPSLTQIWLYVFGIASSFVLDFAGWNGAYGMFATVGTLWLVVHYHKVPHYLSAFQLYLCVVYIGCGLAKLGPAWDLCFPNEWTTVPWVAGNTFLRNLFYKNGTNKILPNETDYKKTDGDKNDKTKNNSSKQQVNRLDIRPTRLAKNCSHIAGLVEAGAPLLLLISRDLGDILGVGQNTLRYVGFWSLVGMHTYILLHLGPADVFVLNWYCVQPLLVWHFLPESGFSFVNEFLPLCPWYLKLWITLEILRAICGHLWTQEFLQHPSYRFWAGNYSHGFYVFSKEGRRKFDLAVGWEIESNGSVKKMDKGTSEILSKLGLCGMDHMTAAGILTKEKTQRAYFKTVGHTWFCHLNYRLLPKLASLADPKSQCLSDMRIYPNIHFNQWVLGLCCHEMRVSPYVMSLLQRECKFLEGECRFIGLSAFPTGLIPSSVLQSDYYIWDLGASEMILEGKYTPHSEFLQSLRRPSDWCSPKDNWQKLVSGNS